MFVLANFINAVAVVLNMALGLYKWILIARIIISWVNADPYNPIVNFIYRLTEPLLSAIRNKFPLVISGLDLSPLIVFFIIYFLQEFLIRSLFGLALRV